MQDCSVQSKWLLLRSAGLFSSVKVVAVQFCQGGCCSVLSGWLLFSSVRVVVVQFCQGDCC